jgi:hypothetical protein
VHDAEDGRAGSNPDRQCQHGNGRIQRRAPQCARAIGGVLAKLLPEILSIHVVLDVVGERAALGAHARKVTEATKRGLARLVGRESFLLQPSDKELEVSGQFIIDLIVDGRTPEEPCTGAEQLSHLTITRA